MNEKSVYDIRRENLDILIKLYGSISRINQLTGRPRTDSSFSQIRHQTVNNVNNRPRRMGSKLARVLEKQLSLSEGWFDVEHPEGAEGVAVISVPFSDAEADSVKVSHVDSTDCRMSSARDDLEMGYKFLRKVMVSPDDAVGLRYFEVETDDFKDLPRDSIVIVNTNVHEFTSKGFYLAEIFGNRVLVKIRRGIDGKYVISSEDDEQETRDTLDGITIMGRALYIWKGSHL